jgi:hypothetical protein
MFIGMLERFLHINGLLHAFKCDMPSPITKLYIVCWCYVLNKVAKAKCCVFFSTCTTFLNTRLKVPYNRTMFCPYLQTFFKIGPKPPYNQTLPFLNWLKKFLWSNICLASSFNIYFKWSKNPITKHPKLHSLQLAHPTFQLCALKNVSWHPWPNITHATVGQQYFIWVVIHTHH